MPRAISKTAPRPQISEAEWETPLALPKESTPAAYDRLASAYNDRNLTPAELELLKYFRAQWGKMSVLELGCGSGRSAHTFSAVAKRYVGIDFSVAMIERCQTEIGNSKTVEFTVADAADLSRYYGQKFDLVFFGYNGIDCVDRPKRLRIYQEVKKVLAADGTFFFSSHCLDNFPFKWGYPRFHPFDMVRWLQHVWAKTNFYRRIARENSVIDFTEARSRGWAVVQDGTHDFSMLMYYTTLKKQLEDLREIGLRCEVLLDSEGRRCSPDQPNSSYWFHYLCHRK